MRHTILSTNSKPTKVAGTAASAGVSSVNGSDSHTTHGGVNASSAFSTQFVRAMNKATEKLALMSPNNPSSLPNSNGTAQSPGSLQQPHAGPSHSSKVDSGQASSHDFYERALRLLSYRQELLASNIANADTPGYKAVDIEAGDALSKGLDKQDVPLKYQVPYQGSVDGNTVEMDVERTKLAENAIRYEFAVDRVKGHYMMMDNESPRLY